MMSLDRRASRVARQYESVIQDIRAEIDKSNDDVRISGLEKTLDAWQRVRDLIDMVRDEASARTVIRELSEMMEGMVEGGSFHAYQTARKDVQELIGDTYLSGTPAPRSRKEAIDFLDEMISEEDKKAIRSDVRSDPRALRRSHFMFGMAVRNKLRSAGFTASSLDVDSLDEIWADLVLEVVSKAD